MDGYKLPGTREIWCRFTVKNNGSKTDEKTLIDTGLVHIIISLRGIRPSLFKLTSATS